MVLARRWGDFSECHVLYVYWLSRWLSGVQDPVLVLSFVRTHLCVCVVREAQRERDNKRWEEEDVCTLRQTNCY